MSKQQSRGRGILILLKVLIKKQRENTKLITKFVSSMFTKLSFRKLKESDPHCSASNLSVTDVFLYPPLDEVQVCLMAHLVSIDSVYQSRSPVVRIKSLFSL